MERFGLVLMTLLISDLAVGQIANAATMDSADYKVKDKVTVEGYVDSLLCVQFQRTNPKRSTLYRFHVKTQEVNINLAFIDIKYSSPKVRARVVPGSGTYMNMNYSQEPGSLKNLVEANAGIKLFRQKTIWLDVGILGSSYTYESAISKDHLVKQIFVDDLLMNIYLCEVTNT